MISIIYPYRNRELKRIQYSLNTLARQNNQNFEVYFIDYGSEQNLAKQVKELVNNYSFVNYQYTYNSYQPWNKCKALNFIIKNLQTPYFFVADIDMLFHPQFVEIALNLAQQNKATYFQVGMLTAEESYKEQLFENYQLKFKTNEAATGMTLFPVKRVQELRGFDEFYHFWGSEDTDMHVRLKNYGVEIDYYDTAVLLLHQWHTTYRMKEKKQLTQEFQLTGIVQLNYQHLMYAIVNERTVVNTENWGSCMTQEELKKLENPINRIELTNEKKMIDHWLYVQLNNLKAESYSFKILNDKFQNSFKYWIKKIIGMKVPAYYSLKEINDMLLLQTISYYNNIPYTYKISDDLRYLEFCVLPK